MNPLQMMQIKNMMDRFHQNHPKVQGFFGAAAEKIDEGSVIEISLTTSEGKTICSNIRVSRSDMELIGQAKQMMQG